MIPHHEISSLPPAVLDAYPTRYFIETGTNTGKGVEVALAHRPAYQGIWSCERDHILWEIVHARYTDADPVRIIHADSPTFLRNLLDGLEAPAFIYLDAHTETENPLFEELAAIATAPGLDHIIAVDDVRMFGRRDVPGWRPINIAAVRDRVRASRPDYTFRRWDTVNGLGDLLIAARQHPEVRP